ncbi:MAG: hypothetical protein J6A83_05780 [Clostridia bacterium]|nr:hypothetical protein [Clostridia bacterium]
MATYNLTPAERRARAQAIVQARENRISYSNYLRDKKALEEMQEAERQRQLEEESRNNSANFLVRGLSTIGDVVGNVLTGAVKGLEGIVDLGIAAVGAVGGIFSDDFQDTMRQAVSYDFAGEIVGNPLQEAMKYSYLENGGIVEQVSSGIGQMLPAVIATIATYGAYGGFAAGASAAQVAAAQAAAQTASLVTLGVSAAGTSTEEAFNEGANYYAGLGYGVASGLVEVGTEKLFGGATKALTGAGVFDGITKSVAETGWKRVARNALEEGAEEVIAELARPALKTIYKGTDALSEYGEGEYWKGVGTAGLVGSMTALAYSGSIGYGLSKAGIGYSGKEADISDSLTEIGSLRERAINFQAEDTLDETNERKIADATKKNYQNIEGVLKSVSETRRAKLIEKFSLSKAFNADGTMSEQLSAWFNGDVTEARVNGSTENDDYTPLASPKKTSYSFSLRGNEATIQSDLDRLSENRAQAYLEEHQALGENITIEQAREAVGKFSVLTSEMSDKAKAARRKFNKALNALNRISGLNTSFVITEANETFDGSLVDNERMYISADAFENDTWAETIVHEVTHLEEGSEEYAKMVDFLQSDDILVDVQTESGEVKRIPLWQKAQSAVLGKDYGFDENKIKVISEKVNAQMGLTPEEVKLYREFMTEVAAHETQYLLGTEAFIDKIVASDRSLARKLVDKILNLKEAFSKVGDKATRGQLKMLRQAEKLYLDAARKAGDMRLVKYILSRSPETEEEVDSDAQIVYNRKGLYKQIPKQEYAIISSRIMEDNSRFMAREEELPRYGAARSANYFYVYENFAPGNFGVLKQIKITDANREYIASIEAKIGENNGESIIGSTSELNRVLEVLKSQARRNRRNNALDSEGRANSDNGGIPLGESEGKRTGDSQKGNGNKQGVRFALKDTVEQDVLAKYGKTYRWTEAGYILKDGTRLDLSGRNEGASGGYRTVDHRDIFDIYEDSDDYGTDAMNQFMARGNIRVMPESPGINLQVEPTEEQYRQIQDLVERLGWKERYFSVDFDDANGDTIDNITYEGAVSARKVVADIKYFFKEGSIPHQSELSKFRFSLKETKPLPLQDSEGSELSPQQRAFFEGSQVRDDEGRLRVVYHGTMSGAFTVFDASKANPESDMGAGFYFSSSYDDVGSNYEDGGQDLDNKIDILADRIEAEEGIDHDEAYKIAYDRLVKESHLFEVYLDMKNPAYVGGFYDEATILFRDFYESELDIEDFENEDDYYEAQYEEQDEALAEIVDEVDSILSAQGISGYEDWVSILSENGAFEGGITLAEMKEILNNNLYDVYDENGNNATNELVRAIVEALGYDGIIDNSVVDKWGYNSGRTSYMQGLEEDTRHYIVFKPEQIKLTSNLNPTKNQDIRFLLSDDPTAKPYFYELTDGQVKKLLANSTKMKVYSKVESEGIINDILGNYMSFGDVYGVLSGKSKAEVIDMLWRGLNTAEPGRRAKVALDVAEYIIQHSVVESMYDDASTEVYMDTIALLKPYLHKINLNGIKGEIKHRYDRDNSPYLLWGKRKGDSGLGADVIAMELDELGFHIDAINEADIFFQIDEAYRSAVAGLKKEAKSMLDSALNAEERKQLKQEIARQVLIAFDEKGKPSKLSAFLEEYAKKAKVWREKYYEERSKNKLLNRVLDKIQKLKDIKLGTFLNASQFKNDVFKGSIERLANIKYRGNLNESGTRGILDGLAEWYVKENPMLQGVFDEDIASALLTLARGEGKLTVNELKALENVVDYFKHFVETYNKVWRGGQYVEAQPIAEKYVSIVRRNKPAKVGWLRKFFEKYETSFADPMTLVRYMDRYDDGFYTEILQELRKGAVGASVMEMEMREPLEAFYKKHKKFLKEMSTKTIEYQGTQIPLAQAMLLYMSLNRDQAILGLAKSGFTFNDGKETIRLAGFALEEDLEIEEIRVRAKEVQSALASQFTEVEKEYISIAEKLFNETCKEAKKKTDILRRGYTNALEDYYVPIRRANIAHNVDTSTFFDEMSRVSNASFNRDTVKGAKNELFIESLDAVLDRHIRAVAQYANLALAIDQYNLLYNLDIGDNPNKPTSVKTESVDMWSEGDAYFKKLISDIQGIPASKGDGVRFMGWLRGSYAKYQLGANPKVWITQLSSFAAAGNILDIDCIIKGIGVKASDVDEYCGLAKVRNTENAAALAQGVVEKTGKVGDILMKPIGMVDRFVIVRLFGACQLQIEKNEGLKVGTKENKVKAGELLEKVILETQQNALATEKSSAMRSGSELMKTLTMFSADSMKVIGRVVDAIGEVSVLKAKRKLATDPDEIASLDKKIKAANKKARRAVGSLVSSAVFMALVAQLFRWLYNKDDEDDNVAVNMTVDAIGNLLGGLPLIRDIYSRFAEGYDFDNYAYSAINDMFDSAERLFTTAGNIFEGDMDSREVALTIKNLLYAGGQMFGIPTRNVYNIIYGLTKRISPSTAYSIDDMFYKQNYRSDLAKAIEQEDEAMIATITSLMLDENIGGITDSEARKELDSLVQKGFDVIPRSVSKKITYDGVEYELTPNQVKQFEKVYFVANEALASLVKMSQYKGATDEVKAKAVNFIYNVYYNLALQDFLGVDLETKSVLFAEAIDIEKLAIIVATANSLKADLDKKGVAISGTRKAKIQSYVNSLQLKAVEKYMIMGYLGYKNTKGEIQVKAYINRLSLTKTEKAKLLEYSGYAS